MHRAGLFILSVSIMIGSVNFSITELEAQTDPKKSDNTENLYKKGKELYDQKKYNEALPYLEKAANMGNSDAQMHLGKMYFNGWGVKHSHEKAKEWHKKAAAQGNKESIEKLKHFKHDSGGH